MINDNKVRGNVYILLTAIFLSFSTVYTHHLVQDVHPMVFAFYSFALVFGSLLFLKVIYFREPSFLFSSLRTSYKSIIGINVTSAIDWILFLIAVKYIHGGLVNAIVFGITPIATLIFSKHTAKKEYIFAGSILLLLLMIGINYLTTEAISYSSFSLALAFSILAGIAVGGSIIFLKSLHNEGVSVFNVILFRYMGTIITALFIIVYQNYSLEISLLSALKIACISFLFVLLPSYFSQKGIAHISSFNVAAISASIPAMTYVIDVAVSLHFHWIQMIAIICLSVVLFLNTYSKA